MKTMYSVSGSDMGNIKLVYKVNEGGEEIVVDNNKKRLEILTLIKRIETIYLDPKNFRENQYDVIKETFEDAKAYFNEYKGDMSLVLEKLAEERQKAGKPMPEWLKGKEAVEEYKETVGALDNFQDAWSLAIDFKNIVAELKRDEEKREKTSKGEGEVENASEEVKEKVETTTKEQFKITQEELKRLETNDGARAEFLGLFNELESIFQSLSETYKEKGYDSEGRNEQEEKKIEKNLQEKMNKIKEILNTSFGDFSGVTSFIPWARERNVSTGKLIETLRKINQITKHNHAEETGMAGVSRSFYTLQPMVNNFKEVADALLAQGKDKEIDE